MNLKIWIKDFVSIFLIPVKTFQQIDFIAQKASGNAARYLDAKNIFIALTISKQKVILRKK
ncbi:MAG: hypothetical protein DRH34_07520 [Deltaproteobacteria bacterium]|nr:MAG: hypothetical protein DRH34_07520 [Deltaproteobacteria bacterium]RLC25788.1 MAG: hypothetical protein DRH93_00895 [Deltaproteobacteria bacterium]